MIQLEKVLYIILIEFWVPMKVFRPIKMCLNETCMVNVLLYTQYIYNLYIILYFIYANIYNILFRRI
jgi:hypothetical protein